MIKKVNTGIAMGNAVEELKEVADYITSNIFDDGIYNAMKAFELI
jgi:hydroxymethylpyrimidine pyrophosphatase-like HAD family hydrolase